jgi:hypothetical protein
MFPTLNHESLYLRCFECGFWALNHQTIPFSLFSTLFKLSLQPMAVRETFCTCFQTFSVLTFSVWKRFQNINEATWYFPPWRLNCVLFWNLATSSAYLYEELWVFLLSSLVGTKAFSADRPDPEMSYWTPQTAGFHVQSIFMEYFLPHAFIEWDNIRNFFLPLSPDQHRSGFATFRSFASIGFSSQNAFKIMHFAESNQLRCIVFYFRFFFGKGFIVPVKCQFEK